MGMDMKTTDYHGHLSLWKELLQAGLSEDGWQWDWTTLGTIGAARGNKLLKARVIAKSQGVWAGASLTPALNQLATELGATGALAKSRLKDGDRFKPGDVLSEWNGPARLVLALERPFLNLASYASGIATQADRLVSIVRKACPRQTPRVTSTRKTLPGYRDVGNLAIQAGGGFSHRVSLSGGVLIKENHVAAAGGIARAIEGARAVAPHGLKIEIEVRSLKELAQALQAKADVVMLDNFTPDQVRAAVNQASQNQAAQTRFKPMIEVSGGLSESNIAQYAQPGVDILSVGSLTHSVKSSDFSLLALGLAKL
jgi:nicotinate-nucleotide pyrophosphorylase (carboxylating)